MSTIFDNDILIHHIAAPGLPGDGFTATEAAIIRNDLDALLARPIIDALDDIPNVTDNATTGQSIVKQADGSWAGANVGLPISATQHDNPFPAGSGSNIRTINVYGYGLTPTVDDVLGHNRLNLQVKFGGTGASSSVARADHTHQIFADREFLVSPSGTLSGGTRTLVNSSITGLDPARTYIIKGTLYLHARGDGTGASYVRPRVTINTNSKDVPEDMRPVAGVLITEVVPHVGVSVTGVSSVPVGASVAFQPGDPAYIGGGVLVIEIEANR